MKNKKLKKAGALLLAAVTLGSSQMIPCGGLLTSLAAGSVTPISEYDEAAVEAFKDNVLEYWEIPGLIEHYNLTYQNQLESFYFNPDGSTGLSKEQLTTMAAEMRYEAAELQETLDEMELDESDELYKDYKENIKILKRYARELESSADGSASTKRTLKMTRNQLTVEISAKMRDYQNLKAQDEIQKKNLEIAELTYQSALRQRDLGIYSNENVMTVLDSYNAAKSAADSAAATLVQGKQSLIADLGWSYDGNPEILAVPEPDMTKIAGYNPEADMETAINNNYDIIDIRKTDSSELGGATEKRRQIKEQEDSVKMQLEYLYKDVKQKELSYQAALNGFTVAEANMAQADRKYALGMLSRQEYLTAEVTYLSVKASKEQAGLDLTASMENYEWAVKGLITQ